MRYLSFYLAVELLMAVIDDKHVSIIPISLEKITFSVTLAKKKH